MYIYIFSSKLYVRDVALILTIGNTKFLQERSRPIGLFANFDSVSFYRFDIIVRK